MEKNSLTYSTFKNSSWSMFGYIWPILFTLFITPIIVFTVGVKDYGIYIFINSAMGLFGLFELGYSVAVLKYLSFYLGKKDEEATKKIIHSSNLVFLTLATIGLVVSIFVALGGIWYLPASFIEYEKYSKLFIIAGGINFFTTVTITYSLVLQALQRFDINTKLGIISITFSNIAMLIAVKLGGSIQSILSIQLFFAFIFSIATYHQSKKILPIGKFKISWHKEEIIKCFKFGIIAYINNIANVALVSLDRMIIPFFVGPSNLTYYTMPGNLAMKIPGITNTLTVNMLPTASHLSGGNEIERMKILYVRSFRLLTVVATALTVSVISFSQQFLTHWLSIDFSEKSASVLIVLTFTGLILALFGPLSGFLLGIGKLKFLTIASSVMGVLNAIVLFILLPNYGIVGAAWAYLISVLPVLYMFYYVEKNFLNLPKRFFYYRKIILSNIFIGLVIFCFNTLILNLLTVNIASILILGGVSMILFFILYKICGFFEEEDWKDLERFTKHIFSRISHR